MAILPQKRLYIGYSSVDASIKKTQFADLDLIKRDLANNFYTRKGERLMNPTFGCIIWDMLFEPMTSDNIKAILDDCTTIVTNDGRVTINSINLIEYDNGIQLQMDLYYTKLNTVDQFSLNFDKRNLAASQL
jgi:phage baseplate assembly protein W